MSVLRSRSSVLWVVILVTIHGARVSRTVMLQTENHEDCDSDQKDCDDSHHQRDCNSGGTRTFAGPEPGDQALAFRVPTLDGEFVYQPGALQGSLFIHTFTNKSGFLECLWSTESSLSALVQDLPESAHVLFVSADDSAVSDVMWMREQLVRVATNRCSGFPTLPKTCRKQEVLSRLHFSAVPLFALGNWIANVAYYWNCNGSCGLSQAVFTSEGWNIPVIVKRLDARYDWLGHEARWTNITYKLVDAGDGCEPSPSVEGAVAWVSESNCSFFTKMQSMSKSNATGVLVYALPGNPIQDMNCNGDECNSSLSIPAAMVHLEPSVTQALQSEQLVNVSFQKTSSPNFFIAIDQQGALAEMGLFLYPSFSFLNWQAQWFEFIADLKTKLQLPAKVVSVFNKTQMQGEKGAMVTVNMPSGLMDFDRLELDMSLSCPGRRDMSCAHWDHTVQLFVCCNDLSPYCNMELGRWITAFRRRIGHWLTDVSPLIPLLDSSRCTFTMKTPPWAKLWLVSLNLRFSANKITSKLVEMPRPFRLMSLYSGGIFDKNYNKRYQPINFTVPVSTKKVELFAVITAHGSDENKCGEFCITSHHFLINTVFNNTLTFDTADSPLGCTTRVKDGAVPNEYGTWLYGRGGWCGGLQVDPWRTDITEQLEMTGCKSNTIAYFGLFKGQEPNSTKEPGYIIMSSFLIFYK